MAGGAGYLRAHFQSRMVQVSFYSMILFYIVANPWLFEHVTRLVNAVLKEIPGISPISSKGQAIVVLHSIVFGLALYILTVYVFDPVMKMTHVIEGASQMSKTDRVKEKAKAEDLEGRMKKKKERVMK
jgi:hypothetical protein